MFGRVTIWVFYAAVFFMLGAWLGPQPAKIESLAGEGWHFGQRSWAMVRGWAAGENPIQWPGAETQSGEALAPQIKTQAAQAPAAPQQTAVPPVASAPVSAPDPVINEEPAAKTASDASSVAGQSAAKPQALDQKLAEARAAYGRGDISSAILAYQFITSANPGDLVAQGEMGNVLYATGRLQEAANAYYTVALGLLERGDASQAGALEAAIRRGNPAMADDLHKRLGQ